jgi:hypothetical protein
VNSADKITPEQAITIHTVTDPASVTPLSRAACTYSGCHWNSAAFMDRRDVVTAAENHTFDNHTAPGVVHGYRTGDRVRDTRDGSVGTVHVFETDPADAGEDVAPAEVRWDGGLSACELDVAIGHLVKVQS